MKSREHRLAQLGCRPSPIVDLERDQRKAPWLSEMSKQCLANSRRWFPTATNRGDERSILHMTLGLAGEVGEVVEVIKKLDRDDAVLTGDKSELALELADVFAYLLNLAELCGIDLGVAHDAKQEICEQRYQERQEAEVRQWVRSTSGR